MRLEEPQLSPIPSFEELELHVPKPATPEEPEIVSIQSFKTTFNGIPVTLEVRSQSNLKKGNQLYYENIRIIVSSQTSSKIADVDLTISEGLDGVHRAGADVTNRDRNIKGLGRALWELSLKLIQKFSDERNISITDEIKQLPHMGLSKEKWNELFVPLLTIHGYKEKEPSGLWEKVYIPGKE